MTRQEAIEILRDTPIDIRSTREDDIHTLYATAQGMAIEALEKHGDEPVGCYGCVHERHGNQVCDACARSCLDRYVGGDSDDNTGSD